MKHPRKAFYFKLSFAAEAPEHVVSFFIEKLVYLKLSIKVLNATGLSKTMEIAIEKFRQLLLYMCECERRKNIWIHVVTGLNERHNILQDKKN